RGFTHLVRVGGEGIPGESNMATEIVPIKIEDVVTIRGQAAQRAGCGVERVEQVFIPEGVPPLGERDADDHVLVSRRKLRESEGLLNAPVDFARHSVQLITQPVIQRQSSARAPIVVGEEVELREAQTDGRIRRAYCQRLKDSRRNAERSQIGATEESR